MRRRARLLLLLALVALPVWVVICLMMQDDGPGDRGQAVEREDTPEALNPSLRGHAVNVAAGTSGLDPASAGEPDTIRVRVTRQEDGVPIPYAHVAVGLANVRERAYGVVLADDVRMVAATDEEGVAALPRPKTETDESYVIRARAEGYVAGRLPWLGADEVGLALSAGKTLSGQVVDADGRPVAGVTVTATAVGAPTDVWGFPPMPWTATRAEVVTDGQGRFVLDDLGDGAYRLGVQQVGWALRRSRSRRPERRASGAENTQSVWAAGAEDARIVVERIGVLTVSFRDAATGRGLQPAVSELLLALRPAPPWVAGGEVDLSPHPYFDGRSWSDPSEWRLAYDVYRFVVPVRSDAPLPLTVQLVCELYDEARGTAQVELREPLFLLAVEEGDGVRVRADPEAALVGPCSVLVRETPPPPHEETAPPPLLCVRPEGHGVRRVRGWWWPDRSSWIFAGLPSGRTELALGRDGVVGEKRLVDLKPRDGLSLELPAPIRSGVRLRVEDPQGRLVFGLDHLSFTARSSFRSNHSLDPRLGDPRWDELGNGLEPPVLAVPSGHWTVSVHEEGLGWAGGDVRVEHGAVTDVTVRFP